jgi:hypothetical protein
MINAEQTARIACSFIAAYYKGFVEDLPSLIHFYGEQSSTSFARVREAVATTSQGKAEVQQYLERLNADLGQRKVEVQTADFVPTGDGSVAIVVTGLLFTKRLRQAFTQTFVLSTTKYKENTMYIAADSLRIMSQEQEALPSNAIVVRPGEDLTVSVVNTNTNKPVESTERKERPRKERKPKTEAPVVATVAPTDVPTATPTEAVVRKERKIREPRVKNDAVPAPAAPAAPSTTAEFDRKEKADKRKPRRDKESEAAPVHQAPPAPKSWAGMFLGKNEEPKPHVPAERKEKPERSDKPSDRNKKEVAEVPKAEAASSNVVPTAAPKERTLTSKVRLIKIPTSIRCLSEVRTAAGKFGNVKDAF